MRRRLLAAGMLALAFATAAPAVRPDDHGTQAAGGTFSDAPHLAQAHRIAERALAFLASKMRTTGSFERVGGEYSPHVAGAALAALAFMANGHTADDGADRFGPQLRLLLDWLLTQAQVTPCTCSEVAGAHDTVKFVDPSFNPSQTHGHGYATWALAMAYGMSFGAENEFQRARVKSLLQGAVHALERCQAPRGGWMYTLEAGQNDHEGSVTVTVLQALRAAKEAGLRVDAGRIANAVAYLDSLQQRTGDSANYGAFAYRYGEFKYSFALTAAAVSSLNQTGDYDSKAIDLGIAYMRQNDPLTTAASRISRWPWYERLYATQAYFQYRDLRHFRQWYPQLVEDCARTQSDDGSFQDGEFGDIYATASAALTLAIPFGYLPTFQR